MNSVTIYAKSGHVSLPNFHFSNISHIYPEAFSLNQILSIYLAVLISFSHYDTLLRVQDLRVVLDLDISVLLTHTLLETKKTANKCFSIIVRLNNNNFNSSNNSKNSNNK